MFRLVSLFLLVSLLFACGASEAQPAATAAATTAPSAELKLNERGRVDYTAVLTFTDGPFAGTYNLLKTKENSGSITIAAVRKDFLKKRPQFAGKSSLTAINMTTANGNFGIRNLSRWFTGAPEVGQLAGHSHVNPSAKEPSCGGMQLVTNDAEGVIRHVNVEFVDCGAMDITGFGDEWKTSKYAPNRKRPASGRISERVRIEDINTTADTRTAHETTMTLTFVGAHLEETE